MVQANPRSVLADPGLIQILSLVDPLEIPIAVIDEAGFILYDNPAFAALRLECGFSAAHVLLRDWVTPSKANSGIFLASGKLNYAKLPYCGPCQLNSAAPKMGMRDASMRLEVYRDCSGMTQAALCTLAPSFYESLAQSPIFFLKKWQPRIEEITDSFDPERIGMKTCLLLQDLTSAQAVAFYWQNGESWQKADQVGQTPFPDSTPFSFPSKAPWIAGASSEQMMSFADLRQMCLTHDYFPSPDWVGPEDEGFVLACAARGDTLGLAFVWTEAVQWQPSAVQDLLYLVSFHAAQAVDTARWFEFARQSESRNETFIDNANAIILGMDLRGNVTLWNSMAQRAFGYSRSEILGQSFFELLCDGNNQPMDLRHRFETALANKEPMGEFEVSMRDRHGQARHVVWTTNFLSSGNGSVLGLYAIGQDITRRKELEERLAVSEKRYRSLVESTHDLYWLIRTTPATDFSQGHIVFLNRAFAGHNRDGLVGRNVEVLEKAFAPQSWKKFVKTCEKVLRTGKPVHHLETEHLRPSAALADTFLMTDIFPMFDGENIIGVQGLSIDITDRKDIESQMLQAQKLESMGRLAQGITHDFNNILNGINGFTYLIETNAGNAEKVASSCTSIKELAGRAGRLTRQLQTYASEDAPEKRSLDLNEIIRQTIKILDASLTKKLKIGLELSDKLDWIEGDRSQVEQVIMNLCINAAEAMSDDGVLTVKTETIQVAENDGDSAGDPLEGSYSLVQVIDTGSGMPPEVKDRIFDPFFTTKKTGNGLGLSAVFGILKRHNASVRVDSEVGVGTCFSLYFPAAPDKRARLGIGGEVKLRGGHETILIVDDEPSIRLVAEDILSGLGYTVILASDGEDAVKTFMDRPRAVDLVLTDIAMPNLNGRAAAKVMRLARPDVPILFVSGHYDRNLVDSLRDDPFSFFLPKPYSMYELQEAVRKALDHGESKS